jgi:transcriptional regulator with XRE-family HTH domain
MSTPQKEIGDKIRTLRAAKDMSQESLAATLEMSLSGFAKIERGETDVSISRLTKIAKALEVPLTSFLQEEMKLSITGNEVVFVHNHGAYNGKNETTEIQNLREEISLLKSAVSHLTAELANLKQGLLAKK